MPKDPRRQADDLARRIVGRLALEHPDRYDWPSRTPKPRPRPQQSPPPESTDWEHRLWPDPSLTQQEKDILACCANARPDWAGTPEEIQALVDKLGARSIMDAYFKWGPRPVGAAACIQPRGGPDDRDWFYAPVQP